MMVKIYRAKRMKYNAQVFREEDHPRDADGKFGKGSGSKKKESEKKAPEKKKKLTTVNPTGGVFVDYKPEDIYNLELGENMTTLAETAGYDPDEKIMVYRGVSTGKGSIGPGDFITTNKQLAQDYAGTGTVVTETVRAGDILDDSDEPLGEEYIYYPEKKEKNKGRDDLQKQRDDVIAKYKGTDKWMKAPNGEETELTEKQWIQTRTDSFKKWFGDFEDERNKDDYELLLNDDGDPKIFYHDSRKGDFEGIVKGDGEFGGIFILPDQAAGYAKKEYSYQLFLRGPVADLQNLENKIYELEDSGAKTYSRILKKEINEETADRLTEMLTDGSDYPTDEDIWDIIGAYDESSATIESQKLRGAVAYSLGFGAVVTPDEFGGDTIMVVDPLSIKSATDNTGGFDPNSPKIKNSSPRKFIYRP